MCFRMKAMVHEKTTMVLEKTLFKPLPADRPIWGRRRTSLNSSPCPNGFSLVIIPIQVLQFSDHSNSSSVLTARYGTTLLNMSQTCPHRYSFQWTPCMSVQVWLEHHDLTFGQYTLTFFLNQAPSQGKLIANQKRHLSIWYDYLMN